MKFFNTRSRKYILASSLIILILISFFVSNPNPDFEYRIINFSIESEKTQFRTGYPINFSFEILGAPSEVIVIWGDGNIETIETKELEEENGILWGTLNHNYSIQGKFTPKLQFWDKRGKEYSKSIGLTVQNDLLQFNINLTCNNQIFEDQEVLLSIQDIIVLNEGLNLSIENFTYLYDFSESIMGDPPKCAICGFSDIRALEIDHIHNDGSEHRSLPSMRSGRQTYNWLIKNNFPDDFQVLCANCNRIKEAEFLEWDKDIDTSIRKYQKIKKKNEKERENLDLFLNL